jgi:hypothetical protein
MKSEKCLCSLFCFQISHGAIAQEASDSLARRRSGCNSPWLHHRAIAQSDRAPRPYRGGRWGRSSSRDQQRLVAEQQTRQVESLVPAGV